MDNIVVLDPDKITDEMNWQLYCLVARLAAGHPNLVNDARVLLAEIQSALAKLETK